MYIVEFLLIPSGLIVIMFGLGLSLNLVDFRRIIQFPRALLVGLFGQIILFPLLAFEITRVANLSPEIAISLIVIAACPGGVMSNALTFFGRADVALSITLTAVSSVITIFTAPIFLMAALRWFYFDTIHIDLEVEDVVLSLFSIAVLPVMAGVMTRLFAPRFAKLAMLWGRPAMVGILLSVISFSTFANFNLIKTNFVQIAPVAFVLNLLCMAAGAFIARQFLLNEKQCVTIAVEMGVQNATMATFISISILHRFDFAVAPTIYAVIGAINALLLLYWFSNRNKPSTLAA